VRDRLIAAGVKLADEQQAILIDGWFAEIEATLGGIAEGAIDPRFVEGVIVEARRS
jgi:hypothetical protein